jgi:hypothetical protein
MPKDDDEFTAEDEANFGSMTEDDIKQVEKFRKWQDKKKGVVDPPAPKPADPDLSKNLSADMSGLTLGQLQSLGKAPKTVRSILRGLLDEADLSESNEQVPAKKKPFTLVRKTNLL